MPIPPVASTPPTAFPANGSSASNAEPPLVTLPEAELARLPGAVNLFGPTQVAARDDYRRELEQKLAMHLSSGFIPDDHTGPVDRLREPSELGEDNLRLQPHAVVFGFHDGEGGRCGFYVARHGEQGREYFLISIEAGDGVTQLYDIFVSPSWNWETLAAHLPPA